MDIKELRKEMQNGVVEFKYIKKDGTIREAKGTTNMDIIPKDQHPKGDTENYPEDIQRYYDIGEDGWRSFIKANLINE